MNLIVRTLGQSTHLVPKSMITSSALKISLLAIFIYMVLDNYYYKDPSADCPSTGYYLARHNTILGCPDDRVLIGCRDISQGFLDRGDIRQGVTRPRGT